MKQSQTNNRFRIFCRSIDEQPKYTFNMLYDEVLKRDELKKSKSKSTLFSHNTTNSNRRFTTNKSQGYIPKYDPDKFNLVKKIKEIQRLTKEKHLEPLQNDSRIAFSKDKIHIVYESTKLLKDINSRKNNSMNDDGESLSTFLTGSKEISINNLLIKLLKEESNKLENKELKVTKAIKEGQDNFKIDQRNFLKYSEMQKKACKEIETLLKDIQKKNIELSQTEKTIRAESKHYEEEIVKVLEHIDILRVCAKFVNHVFNGDISKFENKILPENRKSKFYQSEFNDDEENKINYEEITQRVINDYDFMLTDNYLQIMNDLLRDPYLMILRFKEHEDLIFRKLIQKTQIDEETIAIQQEKENMIKDLSLKEESQTKQYNVIKEEYFALLNECNKININYDLENMEYYELVKELNQTMSQELYLINDKIDNVQKPQSEKNIQIIDIALDNVKKVLNLENVINETINQMETYMNEDKQIFMGAVIARKNQNKENKQALAKLKLDQILNVRRKKAQARMNKIVIKSRKTEAPFRVIKKEKVVIVNEETTQQEEENDLFHY